MYEINIDKKKYIDLALIFICIVMIVFIGTYALKIWRSSENTELSFRIGDYSQELTCKSGNDINISDIGPVFDYNIDGEIVLFNVIAPKTNTKTLSINFYIESISDNLKTNDFKYILLSSTDQVDYKEVINGNFIDLSNNTMIKLIDNLLINNNVYYKLIFYIDGNMENSINTQNGSLNGYVEMCAGETITDTYILEEVSETQYPSSYFLSSSIAREDIEEINFIKISNLPNDVTSPIDVSKEKNNTVLLYSKLNDDTNRYKIYIATKTGELSLSNGKELFSYLSNVSSLDLRKISTSDVTDMSYMFEMSNIASVNLSSFDTSNVVNMSYMFSDCMQLQSVDLSNFDTTNVTNMGHLFDNCSSLMNINISNLNTSNVVDMSYMFGWNSSLTSIDLSNFDTSNVTTMYGMFSGCSNLTSIDLSEFNTMKVTDMALMFYNCSNIVTIYVSSNFNTSKVTSSDDMFSYCSSLMGEKGTKYNSSKTNKEYARIDGTNPGYFSNLMVTYDGGTFNMDEGSDL